MDVAIFVAALIWRMVARLVQYSQTMAAERKNRRPDKWWLPDPHYLYRS